MTQRTSTAEAGTTGAAVSTGVAGPGETAWDAVSILAGAAVYDTAHPAHGSKGIKVTSGNSNCYAQWAVAAHRQGRARGYWYAEAAPAANTATVWLGSAPSAVVIQISRNANGTVKLARSGGVAMWTSGVSLPLNQLVRWELRYSIDPTTSSASQAEIAFYLGDSPTPIIGMSSGLITIDPQTTAEITIARFGKYDTASNSDVVTHDSITHDDADWSALLGPYAQSLEASASDGVGISDTTGGVLSAARGVPDAVGAADSTSATLVASRAAADPVGLTDAVTAVLSGVRAISDAVTVTDLPGPQVLDVALDTDDPAGVTDSVAQLMAAARTIADAAGITDSVTVVLDRAIAADDPIGVTDSAGTALDAGRGAVDAAGVGDQVTVTLVAARAVGDPIGVTDSVTAVLTAAGEAIVSDPAGITDEVTVSITSARGLADAAALTDGVLAVLSAERTAGDQVAALDAVGTIAVAVRSVADGVAVVDTVTATLIRAELPNTPPARRLRVEYESRTVYVRPGRR